MQSPAFNRGSGVPLEVTLPSLGSVAFCRDRQAAEIPLERPCSDAAYLGFDRNLQKFVEIHLFTGALCERRVASAKLPAPAGAAVLDSGHADGVGYLIQPFLDGETLDCWLARVGRLPEMQAVSLALELAEALRGLRGSPMLLGSVRLWHSTVHWRGGCPRVELSAFAWRESDPCGSDASLAEARAAVELAGILFLSLVGRPFSAAASLSAAEQMQIARWPMSLRTLLRELLQNAAQPGMDQICHWLREAYASLARRPVPATPAFECSDRAPTSGALGRLLPSLEMVQDAVAGCGVALSPEPPAAGRACSFPAHVSGGKSVVQVLPGPESIPGLERKLPGEPSLFDGGMLPVAFHVQTAAFSAWGEAIPPQSVPLSEILRGRKRLEVAEVAEVLDLLLPHLETESALEIELPLQPADVYLVITAAVPPREMVRLLERRLVSWPDYTVRVRPAPSLQSFVGRGRPVAASTAGRNARALIDLVRSLLADATEISPCAAATLHALEPSAGDRGASPAEIVRLVRSQVEADEQQRSLAALRIKEEPAAPPPPRKSAVPAAFGTRRFFTPLTPEEELLPDRMSEPAAAALDA